MAPKRRFLLGLVVVSLFLNANAQMDPFVLDYDTAVKLAELPLICYNQVKSEGILRDFKHSFIKILSRNIRINME